MADNIPTKDRSGANLDIASKDVSGVQFPRNILTDAAGADINPALKSQLPTALGSAADAASLAVTHSTEDKARIGSLTETAPATDTASSGLNGRLQRIAQKLTALIAQLPASLGIKTSAGSLSVVPASDARFAKPTEGTRANATINRPSNTTPYAAGDIVGGAVTFYGMATEIGATVLINSVQLGYLATAVPSGATSFRLHLYFVTPVSALTDNAPWDLASVDFIDYQGFIDIGPLLDMGSNLFAQVDGIGKQIKVGITTTSIYGYLQTLTAFTPAAPNEAIVISLGGRTL